MSLIGLQHKTKIDFMGMRRICFAASTLMILTVILAGLFRGINYGVDFKGGIVLEVRAESPLELGKMRQAWSNRIKGEASIQNLGNAQSFLIRVEESALDSTPETVLRDLSKTLGVPLTLLKFEKIGPKVSQELMQNGLIAVVVALFAMLLYIWWRFEWRFGCCALLALVHDCIGVLGLYTLLGFEFNETAIVAILITASYSINDTVVIFDRIRENRRHYHKLPLRELLNLSINETLSRTVLTSATTLVALLVLYFLGGPVISMFSLPILIGLLVGTYSSIFIASPLLVFFRHTHNAPSNISNKNSPT
jgi:preprotein translocase SecF subunit